MQGRLFVWDEALSRPVFHSLPTPAPDDRQRSPQGDTVETEHSTDRGQNARKARKTYCFSKDWSIHVAMTFFVAYSYNFCWPVRTLRRQSADGLWEHVTPAMAAGLADHVWTLLEWITLPARPL